MKYLLGESTVDRRYYAYLKINGFHDDEGCFLENVYMHLRRIMPSDDQREMGKYDFSKLLSNYSKNNRDIVFAEHAILELFTQEEIDEMKRYFGQEASFPQIEFFYEEQTFPINPNTFPFCLEDTFFDWVFELQDGDGCSRKFVVGGYVDVSKQEKISRKLKADLFEGYNLLYAFKNAFDSVELKYKEGYCLAGTSTGEMLEGFTALLLIKKEMSRSEAITLVNKIHNWIKGRDKLTLPVSHTEQAV